MVSTHYTSRPGHRSDYLNLDKDKYEVIFCSPRRSGGLESTSQPGQLSNYVKPGDWPVTGCKGFGLSKRKSFAPGHSFPDRRRYGQTCLSRLGNLGNDTGQIRSRYTRHHQHNSICQSVAVDPSLRNETFMVEAAGKLTAREILYHDELRILRTRTSERAQATLIGRSFLVQQLKASGLISTSTMVPVLPHSHRYGTLSARHGVSPNKYSRNHREVRSICAEVLGAPLTCLRCDLYFQYY